MRIGFIGLGKLGLPVACAIAARGHDVIGYDHDPERMTLDAWPAFEAHPWDDLPAIRFGSLEDVVRESEIVFVAVQTPHAPRYEGATLVPPERIDFDYEPLCKAISRVSVAMDGVEGERTVVVISTCLPGTIRSRVVPLLHPRIRLAYSPLLIAMSQVVEDYYHPELAILGGDDQGAVDQVARFLETIHDAPVRRMSIESAELTKVAYNVAISAKIVQANALMEIAAKVPGVNLEDVTGTLKIATDRLVSPKYMDGGGPDAGSCLPSGELVMTEDGPRAIETIEPGTRVLARDGRLRRVVHRWERDFAGDLVTLQTWGSTTASFTSDHPMLVATDGRTVCISNGHPKRTTNLKVVEALSQETERAASTVVVGDFLPMPIPVDEPQVEPPAHATDEYVELAGFYLSNGSLEIERSAVTGNPRSGRISFSMHARAVRDHQRIAELCVAVAPPRVSGRGAGARPVATLKLPRCVGIRYGSAHLAGLFESDFGRGAARKRLPGWIVYGPRRLVERVLIGMWRGDGHIGGTRASFSTASPDLAYGMQLMLARLGIPSSVRWIAPRNGVNVGSFGKLPTYEVRTGNAKHVNRLADMVGLPRIPENVHKLYDRYPERDGAFMRAVRSVGTYPFTGRVFNLWVEDDHTFTTPVGAVHNCHPRDLIAMSSLARRLDLSFDLFGAIAECRDRQTEWLARYAARTAAQVGLPIAICGMAYKPEVSLTQGSGGRLVASLLEAMGHTFTWYDPHVAPLSLWTATDPAVFLVMTKHRRFAEQAWPRGSVVIDPHRYIPDFAGVRVVRVGEA